MKQNKTKQNKTNTLIKLIYVVFYQPKPIWLLSVAVIANTAYIATDVSGMFDM